MQLADEQLWMSIPFGLSTDIRLPLGGTNAFALNDFRTKVGTGSVPREYFAARIDANSPHFGSIGGADPNRLNQAGSVAIFVSGAVRAPLDTTINPAVE